MTQPEQQQEWKVKSANGERTLFAGLERRAREFVHANFPRPHVVQGQDTVRADVVLHGPDGSTHEFHGADAVGADENGWVTTSDHAAEQVPATTTEEPTA